MPYGKLAIKKLELIRFLNDYCVRLFLGFEFANLYLNLNFVSLFLNAKKIGSIDERGEHGALAAARVTDGQYDILVFCLFEFVQCTF